MTLDVHDDSPAADANRLLRAAALELIVDLEKFWALPGLGRRVHISIGPRLRRSLGRCHPERGVIRVAPTVLTGPRSLLAEVVCHEVAHVAAFERHGRTRRPHGPEWRDLMLAAGFVPRARVPVASSSAESILRSNPGARHYEHQIGRAHV